jgi:hypothetical protein
VSECCAAVYSCSTCSALSTSSATRVVGYSTTRLFWLARRVCQNETRREYIPCIWESLYMV